MAIVALEVTPFDANTGGYALDYDLSDMRRAPTSVFLGIDDGNSTLVMFDIVAAE